VKQHFGIGWYTPWEWARLRDAVSDPERLDDTYWAWRRGAKRVQRELREQGIDCERVSVRVAELAAWCREQNRPVDGQARADFVAHQVAAAARGQGVGGAARSACPVPTGPCPPGRLCRRLAQAAPFILAAAAASTRDFRGALLGPRIVPM
jgi:hypothetical protein